MTSNYHPNSKVAFVTGANGITGNAIIEHLIRQPASEWSKFVITTRRVPKWPLWQDPRIRFIALDFLKPAEELVEQMELLCRDVTHAFFASYVHETDFARLKDCNVPLFKNFLVAIDQSSKSLQRVILHTGGKNYGVHLGPVEVPVHEGMARYEDFGENFYYIQEDFMFELAAKREWHWNIIRPMGIIGYTPAGNGMSMALTVAIYFLICRELGQVPMFPGNKFFYNAVDDASYAPSIADMSVWASTNEHTKNEAFNHNNGDYIVWRYFWAKLGGHFGMEVPEIPDSAWTASGESHKLESQIKMVEWAKDKRPAWERVVAKNGGNCEAFDWATWDILDWGLGEGWLAITSVAKARVLPMSTPIEKKATGLRPHPGGR
ncbi:hypothetical protein KVR01_002608 [Diaporthe batatas]|uniref:uncharacterized protein n=1 Tax=Diaporthe batatas TaxID=748121 RepID=UPI001D050EA2|nr:uncharacterized protein KVR01_002608 [Diaporthe batatas]KAG8166919.1 hypothetical protein KVR01_002608 [Diaporthe batatas]